jgi:hypothetical protein
MEEGCIMRSCMIFYSSPSISRMIKSRSMRWVEHVAGMGEKITRYRLLAESQKGDH